MKIPLLEELKPLDRLPYFWWGGALMAIKYNFDRAIAWIGFHREWYLWNYIRPHGFAPVDAVPPQDQSFYFLLLVTALPVLAAGIFLTLRRLRSAGLPLALCLLFFVPVINLVFFLTLCVVPARETLGQTATRAGWEAWLPRSETGSALVSVLIMGTAGVLTACLSTEILRNYGWGLFVGEPFTMGLVSVLLYAWPAPRPFIHCVGVALLTTFFTGLVLFVITVEGVICLLMAAPIGMALAFAGGMVGCLIASIHHSSLRPSQTLLILFAVPFMMGAESASDEAPPQLSVTSSVVIDAPPERVWPNVVSFSPITEKPEWILRTGIAYPERARIDGQGVGAVRHCIFTTGEFVEPIQIWEPNHLLKFSVAAQPEPMEEMSPYPHLKTPHLEGYFQSQQGELLLTRLPGNRTLLSGTTWYTNKVWPSAYWQIWSDTIIHHIHLRVLNHIKTLSENIPHS
jgi:uncharacterized membrane protein YhaH (DUF805 family)